jgi:hypothetical protein
MVHVYYHIYAIDGVESIIEEQISLLKKHFDFPYTLNIGISIADKNTSISNVLNILDKNLIRDIRAMGNEFTTLDLIEKDIETFVNSDYILYLHTKGASKQNDVNYKNIVSWRQFMNYFNIEKAKNVFKLFERTEFNTYGVLFTSIAKWRIYSGNFWWMTGEYAKTLKLDSIHKIRTNAETDFIQNGKDWKPYSSYNIEGENHYTIDFNQIGYKK